MGKYDDDLAKYIPGLFDLVIQGILDDIDTKEKVDMEQLDFQILLTENYYVNPNSMHICFPIKIKKKSDNIAHIDGDLITVNNFFVHWIKEISVTRYGSDKELPPTFSPWEVYQCSDQRLKNLPSDALKTIQKAHLFSKKTMYLAQLNYNRRNCNSKDLTCTSLNVAQQLAKKKAHTTDLNIEDRIEIFQEKLKNEHIYRIPLRYFSDIGKTNFPTKINYSIKSFLETKMEKLFESRKVLAAGVRTPSVLCPVRANIARQKLQTTS